MSERAKTSSTTSAAPRLRFPEFRAEAAWACLPLGQMAHVIDDRAGTKKLTPMSVTSGVGLVAQTEKFGREIAGSAYKNYIVVRSNDFAYNKSATKDYPEGFIALYEGDQPVAVPNSIFVCFRLTDGTNPRFLNYQLTNNLHGRWLRQFIAIGARAHGSLAVDTKNLLSLPVPQPVGRLRTEEQRKIAACLSSLDDLITAHADKLAALKQHKQGLLEQLFPREGETAPGLRFPEFCHTRDWEPTTLGAVCDVLQGYGFPLNMQGKQRGRYPFCKVSDISRAVDAKGGLLDSAANYVDDADVRTLRAMILPVGSTVFAKIGEALRLNRRAMTTGACLVDNNATGIKVKDANGSDYFMFVLSQRIDMNQYCGGAVPSISKSILESIPITMPQPAEQRRVADAFASLDTLITAESDKLAALQQHKQGLLQQLFPVLDEATA